MTIHSCIDYNQSTIQPVTSQSGQWVSQSVTAAVLYWWPANDLVKFLSDFAQFPCIACRSKFFIHADRQFVSSEFHVVDVYMNNANALKIKVKVLCIEPQHPRYSLLRVRKRFDFIWFSFNLNLMMSTVLLLASSHELTVSLPSYSQLQLHVLLINSNRTWSYCFVRRYVMYTRNYTIHSVVRRSTDMYKRFNRVYSMKSH